MFLFYRWPTHSNNSISTRSSTIPRNLINQMTNNKSNHEAELKAAKRAEIERLWFNQEATNKKLLEAYKVLDIKEKE